MIYFEYLFSLNVSLFKGETRRTTEKVINNDVKFDRHKLNTITRWTLFKFDQFVNSVFIILKIKGALPLIMWLNRGLNSSLNLSKVFKCCRKRL